jgi:fimbrial isopeptide formation D2 family protein
MRIRRILRTTLVAVLAAALFLTALPFEGIAAGSPFETSPFIKKITLTDLTTGQQLGTSGAAAGKNDSVQIKFDFSIPDDVTVDDGTVYSFTIPSEIVIPSSGITETLTMPDAAGSKVPVASVFVSQDGKGTITFNKDVNNYRGVSGSFYVQSKFSGDKIENTTPVPVTFTVEGEADPTTVNVYFTQPEATIAKSAGTYNADTDTVSWTVTLNGNKTTVRDGKFYDTLPDGLTYVTGTFTVKESGTNVVYKDGTSAAAGKFISSGNPLEYDFSSDFSSEYTITYDTKVVSSQYYGQKLTNTAKLDQDGKDVTAQGTVTPSPVYIKKSASPVIAGDKKVDWTITFGRSGETLTNAAVTDNLSKLGALDAQAGVVLDKGTASEKTIAADNTAAEYYTYQNNQLTLHAAAITGQHTVSFSTDLPDGYWEKNESGLNNTAKLTSDDTPQLKNGVWGGTGTVPNTQNKVITKNGAGYDPSTHIITWNININESGRTLASPELSDIIPTAAGNAQQYVAGSLTVTKKNGGTVIYKDGGTANTGTLDTSAGTLTYKFGADISEAYTVTFQTRVTEAAVYANNVYASFTNSASLTTGDGATSSTPAASQGVGSTVISKSASYDYKTREITWTVKADSDKTQLADAIVTDVLKGNGLDSFAFEPSTLTVDGTAVTAGDSADKLAQNEYFYDTSSGKLTIALGNISTEKVMTFKMKLTAPNTFFATNGAKNAGNTATLTDTQYGPVNATAWCTINNGLVTKTGDYSADSDHIDWIVHINQNGVKLSDLKLRDVLAAGLVLDTSSVRIYRETLASDGSLTPNGNTAQAIDTAAKNSGITSEKLGSTNISYDALTNEFDFSVPYESGSGTTDDPYSINSPYVLIFRTYVDAAHNGTSFSNTMSFIGTAETISDTSSPVNVWYASSGSTATGTTGTLTVKKTDSATGETLAGAVFGLYDGIGNLIEQGTTGADGKLSFDFLQYSVPYSVKELTAPTNYNLNSTLHKFEIKKGDESGLYEYNADKGDYSTFVSSAASYAYSDVIKTGSIRFSKIDGGGKALAGATFTLYDSTGNTPVTAGGSPVTAVSGSDGTVLFSGVRYGSYKIKETSAPTDYSLSGTVLTAELTESNKDIVSGVLTLTDKVTDSLKSADIVLRKLGAGGSALAKAAFTLYDASGKAPVLVNGKTLTSVSDAGGIVSFTDIPYGDYTLVETTAPADYAAAAPIKVSLHEGAAGLKDGIYNVGDVTDNKLLGSISFIKLGDGGKALRGATFVLSDASGNAVGTPQISDADGTVTFTGVPYGDGYSIAETQAPADYTALAQPITGISIHSEKIVLRSVTDAKKTGAITFVKTDENGQPLAGAVFALYNSLGVQVGTAQTSDKNGRVTFSGVPFADGYTVKEIKAPENYAVCRDIQANLHTQSYDLGKVADELRKGTVRVKKTDLLGHTLSGAEFALYTSGGTLIGKAVTDGSGVASFDAVTFGEYYVVETNAPKGYLRSDAKFPITLNAANPAAGTTVVDMPSKVIPLAAFPQTGSRGTLPTMALAALALAAGGVVIAGELRAGKRRKNNA